MSAEPDGRIAEAARLLTAAFAGDRLAALPDRCAPASAEAAYAIQHAVLRGERIAGWKVAPPPAGEAPRCAPIAASRLLRDGESLPGTLRVPEVEAELAFLLGADLFPRTTPYDVEEVAAAIASAHVALEFLESRFLDRRAVSPLSTLADAQSNRLLILGEGTQYWRALDVGAQRPTLRIGAAKFVAQKALPGTAAVLDACRWLADHAGARGCCLRAGDIIITGARVGPVSVPPGAAVDAAIPSLGRVRVAPFPADRASLLNGVST